MIVIVLVVAFMILLPLALLSWEMLRYMIASEELRSVCDAAALSGTASEASAPATLTYAQVQQNAMQYAYTTFIQNSLYGTAFTSSNTTPNYNPMPPMPQNPGPGQAILNIVLLDQNGVQVPAGTPAARMRIDAYYGYVPPTGQWLGIGPATIFQTSQGGLPQLDIVMCFDVSGSMDDNTKVTYVKRWYNPALPGVQYDVVTNPADAENDIFTLEASQPTGTSQNALPPQTISYVKYYTNYVWDRNLRIPPLAASEPGQPPGNFDILNPASLTGNGVNPNADPRTVTDVVVNLDQGNAPVAGTVQKYLTGTPISSVLPFPNLATLVEAARGNMNSIALQTSASCGNPGNAKSPTGPTGLPAPNPNYQTEYTKLARAVLSPMAAATSASKKFFDTMNIAADSHFGFVAFTDFAGTSPTDKYESHPGCSNLRIDAQGTPPYPEGGTASYPLPQIILDPANGASQYTQVESAIDSLTPLANTNISDSLDQAYIQLTTKARPNARKAVVLFTDGVPNKPGGSAAAQAAAIASANQYHAAGIPIYAVGLAQNGAVQTQEDLLLNNICRNNTNIDLYISVSNPQGLNDAFQTIARQLVVLK